MSNHEFMPDLEDALGLFGNLARQMAQTTGSSIVADYISECGEHLQELFKGNLPIGRDISTPDYINGGSTDLEPPVPGAFYQPDTDDWA